MKLDLNLKDIQDPLVRENLSRVKRQLEVEPILAGFWKFQEVDIPAAGTLLPIKHNLSFTPKDIILLSIRGDYSVYFNYNEFDETYVYVTAAGPCVIRFFVGGV